MPESANATAWNGFAPHYAALRAEQLAPDRIPDWLRRWSDLEKSVWERRAILKRARYLDTTDEAAEQAYQTYTREVMAQSHVANVALIDRLLGLADDEPAPQHAQMVRRWRNEAALYRAENVAIQAEIAALESAYNRIAWSSDSDADDEKPAWAGTSASAQADPRRVRETAWRAHCTRWLRQRDTLNTLFLEVLTLRRRLARHAGLPDYRAYRWRELNRLDYTPHDTRAHHDAVAAEIVPLVARLRAAQCRAHGIDVIRPWDAGVDLDPRPPLRPYAETHELAEGVARVLAQVDPEFGAVVARLRNGYLHIRTETKQAPVSEEFVFPRTGLPCVFVSPDGSFEDVPLLLHECGHALHDAISLDRQRLFWNMGGPDEFCEFAAMTLVVLADPYLERERGGFYSPEEAARARGPAGAMVRILRAPARRVGCLSALGLRRGAGGCALR